MLERKRFEVEYAPLFDKKLLGATVYSPLAAGFLSGKHILEGEKNSRIITDPMYKILVYDTYMNEAKKDNSIRIIKGLKEIADELKCTLAQMAFAWVLKNPDVTAAITGASSPKQIDENIGCLEVCKLLTPEVLEKIEKVLQTRPEPTINWRTGQFNPPRR